MTLSSRNIVFKTGIGVSLLALAFTLVASFSVFSVYPQVGADAQRAAGFFQALVAPFFQPAAYVAFVTTISSVLYAFITMFLIYYFFEKTQSPEILFFALFVVSLAFESLRIMVPFRVVKDLPSVVLVISARVLIFGRYYGLFSLFVASVYAAGLDQQKQGNVVFIIAVATLTIALGVPIDGLSWDSSMLVIFGFATMFKTVEIGIVLITMLSFFISAYTRGAKEYVFIGIGSVLVSLGRTVLLSADTWVTPLPGLILLIGGTWIICSQLHRVYLWL
ncbi:hypothetical protein [Treponema primitia]|nr:hypothetical protein [Treponema primitia]